jgi:flagellar hook assembly protein FlgD
MFPTAITPLDPDKPFLVYTNYLIDELEVWIFNQWGELIFNCSNKDLISEESTCIWDGTYNGKKIINGSYSVRLNYVNYEKNIRQTTIGSIISIE